LVVERQRTNRHRARSSLDHHGTLLSWRTNGGLIGAVVLSGIVIGYVSRDFDACCR
jgi:hypothetical protein